MIVISVAIALVCAVLLALAWRHSHMPRWDVIVRRLSRPNSRFIALNGVQIHYTVEGAGPAVLLMHGAYGSLSQWDEWLPALTPYFRVVCFDLPGSGLTGPVPSGDYSFEHDAILAKSLMESLGEAKFAIIGNSFGAMVGFRFAAEYPDTVPALVLINSAGVQLARTGARPKAGRLATAMQRFYLPRSKIAAGMRAMCGRPSAISESMLDDLALSQNMRGRQREGRLRLASFKFGNPQAALAKISSPTLVLWGASNPAMTPDIADELVAGLRNTNVKRVDFQGIGHHLVLEAAAEASQEASRFLRNVLSS